MITNGTVRTQENVSRINNDNIFTLKRQQMRENYKSKTKLINIYMSSYVTKRNGILILAVPEHTRIYLTCILANKNFRKLESDRLFTSKEPHIFMRK